MDKKIPNSIKTEAGNRSTENQKTRKDQQIKITAKTAMIAVPAIIPNKKQVEGKRSQSLALRSLMFVSESL